MRRVTVGLCHATEITAIVDYRLGYRVLTAYCPFCGMWNSVPGNRCQHRSGWDWNEAKMYFEK